MFFEYTLVTTRNAFYDITGKVREAVSQSGVVESACVVYCPHTTAAITVNEGSDYNVRNDIMLGLERAFPDCSEFRHSEGNSAAHLKSSAVGTSEILIIRGGLPLLGMWQAVYFCEFDAPRKRTFYVQVLDNK